MNRRTERTEAGGAARHPIGVVARRTGISLHVLRAWERRYGVVEPVRTAGGQRLYSDADIQRLRLLREVTEAGRNISQVAQLTDGELAVLAAGDAPQAPGAAGAEGERYRQACLAAAERLDGEAVHALLMRALVSLRPREFMGDVLLPLLHEVGERWHAGRLGPVQEHVASDAVRRVLYWLLEAYEPGEDAPVLVASTPSGELHEFGAMAAGSAALEEGWRVVYLGSSLPAAEIARAALGVRARLVALSAVTTADVDAVVEEVEALVGALPPDVGVVIGGAGAAAERERLERAGARVALDLGELRDWLRVEGRHVRSGL